MLMTYLQSAYKNVLYTLSTLLLLLPLANNARADAVAFANGGEGSWGWATSDTLKEAAEQALELCNKHTDKKDCAVEGTKAIARAEYNKTIGYGRSTIGVLDARKQALDACGNARCRVTLVVSTPGFYSLVKSTTRVFFFMTYGFSNSDDADKLAMSNCEKQETDACELVWSGAIAGTVKATAP